MAKIASLSAFVNYANEQINKKNTEISTAFKSDLKKAVVFTSSLIPLKTTRTTQGVQLLVSKKGSVLTEIARLAEVGITDPEYYRIRRIPAIGYYIKEDSFTSKQIGFEDLT